MLVAALAVLALLLCAPAAQAFDQEITLTEDGFQPSSLTVDAGDTVRFRSETAGTWSVESDAGVFDSKTLKPAGSYTMSLSIPGVHKFRSTGDTPAQGTLVVRARSLPGQDGDDAETKIPDLPFPAVDPDDIASDYEYGVKASMSRILVGFRPGASVADVNAALADADVRIVGGLPELGTLLVQTGAIGWGASFWQLHDALDALRAHSVIRFAAMSTVTEPMSVPRKSDAAGADGGWNWDDPFGTATWALSRSRFPEAWNTLESVKRKHPNVITGIVDTGFEQHDDLPGLEIQSELCPRGGTACTTIPNQADSHGHGNHVAGIIGAAFDNDGDNPQTSHGVSGGNPVARMYGYSAAGFTDTSFGGVGESTLADKNLELFDLILRSRPPQLRVINYSMGPSSFDAADWQSRWGDQLCGPGARDDDLPDFQQPMKEACTPNNLDAWQREMAAVGMAAGPVAREAARQGVMIVQAAGNDGQTFCTNGGTCLPIDTASRNEFAWISRHWDDAFIGGQGLDNPILEVEATTKTGDARPDATFGADVAAPGDGILSTVLNNGYGRLGGSSMAAPQVTALIGYMLADDPTLSLSAIRRRVLDWTSPRPSLGPVDFTWSMPDRMNRDIDGDAMVDYPRVNGQIEPSRFDVELDACDAGAEGKPAGRYTWKADGQLIGSTADCVLHWRPQAEGTYAVELTVAGADGAQGSVTKQVKVEDLLIVSVGDSIASGEGNPDIASPGARWQEKRCHRSAFAGPAQASRLLEGYDIRSSVTFVHLACSGGRMTADLGADGKPLPGALGIGGLLTPYEGVVPDSPACENSGRQDLSACEPPQIERAKELVGQRVPDALLISIGANDMRFSTILKHCMLPLNDCSTDAEGRGLFEERIALLKDRYAAVAAKIKEQFPTLPSDHVIITQYPDPTTTQDGRVTLDCGAASGIDDVEAQWAHTTVMPALNNAVAAAAQANGWTVATGIPQAFAGHGYCSTDKWVEGLVGSVGGQGDENGAFHPNYAGHSAYAREIVRTLRDRLGLTTAVPHRRIGDRAPRASAFRSVANGGPASRIADFSDASKDGNRRVERTIDASGTVAEKPDTTFTLVPGEKTVQDGRVDMRDLRRYRDAWLQRCLAERTDECPFAGNIALDGGDDHPKRDLNLDGCVTGDPAGCGAREHFSARADLNGDQLLDPTKKALTPWKADGTPAADPSEGALMSDAGVLEAAWSGGAGAEGWARSDVAKLMSSADVQVDANAILDTGAAKATLQLRRQGGEDVGPARTIRRTDGSIVMTVPVDDMNAQYELVSSAKTARGQLRSKSAPFTLKIGEDKAIAACPDMSLDASPLRIPGDGQSTSIITAKVHKCAGRQDVAGKNVTFTLDSTSGGAQVEAVTPATDAGGTAQARFTAGSTTGKYKVKASVQIDDASEPLEAEIEIETVPTLQIRYVWKQTIQNWHESGTTRWGLNDPLMPDCAGTFMSYCVDSFSVDTTEEDQTLGGIQRAGTLTGGGDGFKLTEQVSDSLTRSNAAWTLSDQEGQTTDGGRLTQWMVSDPDAYTDHPVAGLTSTDAEGGVKLTGLGAVGDLPYHYAMSASTWGTVDPLEVPAAKHTFLLVPQAQKILFGAHPDKEIAFPRDGEGFRPFASCGVLDQDLTTQPGYYNDEGSSPYLPGVRSYTRKTTYTPGDRPLPVGPGAMKVRYAFAAVASYTGRPAPEPVLPDCQDANPPVADFDIEPSGEDGVASEGRDVLFTDRSTDPDSDLDKYEWDFGDGKTGSGPVAHHLYDDNGTYAVKLTVTDAKGNADTKTKELEVVNEDPEADVEDATGTAESARLPYTFLDRGHVDKQQLHWTMTSTNPAFPPQSGTDHAAVAWKGPFTGMPAGTYPVRLTVTDKDGGTASDEAVLTITDDPPPPPPPPPPASYETCDPTVKLDAEERTFVDLVNAYREENGLEPVGISATLTRAAERHANDMAAHNYMGHYGTDGSDPGDRAWGAGYPRTFGIGENVAEAGTAVDMLNGWRSSSHGHNENMLNPSWRAIGIARAKGDIWRTATTYGSGLDCKATDAERTPEPGPTAGLKAMDTAPDGAVAIEGSKPVAPEPAPAAEQPADAEAKTAPAPISALAAGPAPTDVRAAVAATAGQAPTIAVATDHEAPRAGAPHAVSNRSRDVDNSPLAATIDFGDQTGPVTFAADETKDHGYPASEFHQAYTLDMEGTGASGRSGRIVDEVRVAPVRAPGLVVQQTDVPAVSGHPFGVAVEAFDDDTGEVLRGLELAFTLEGQVVKATTNAHGVATATVALADRGGIQTVEIAYAGSPDHKPASITHDIDVHLNQAPIAKAGGPYVVGEGNDVLLNGARSKDEDPSDIDHIASYDWDLDGDGAYDDAAGRMPGLTAEQIDATVCGGTCQADHPYPVALRVTDAYGKTGTESTTLKVVPDFDLTLGNENKVVVPGSSNNFAVTVIGSKSYAKPVTLSVTGLPAGVTATFSKNPVTPTDVSILKLTGGTNLQAGTFGVHVVGTDGQITKEVSDQVDVAFGLVPICRGAITGLVTDKTTGAPMKDVNVRISGEGVPVKTDATGRYFLGDAVLGQNNMPLAKTVVADADGFWGTTGTGQAACGALTQVDLKLLDVRKGIVRGKVTDQQTGEPMPGIEIDDAYAITKTVAGTTGADGRYDGKLTLATNNADRTANLRAQKPGYWTETKVTAVKESQPATVDFQLLKKCTGTIEGGRVLYLGTTDPVPFASVGLYITSVTAPDLIVKADVNGDFVVDKTVDLGSRNTPIKYKAYPDAPLGAPGHGGGIYGSFDLDYCGDTASATLNVRKPKPSYGSIVGTVTDTETNLPVAGATVTACSNTGCPTATTDDQGKYAFAQLYLGNDGAALNQTVTAAPAGYYSSAAGWTLHENEVKTLDFKVLKRKYGALSFTVVDAVTKAPIPGARIADSTCSAELCVYADGAGRKTVDKLALGAGNAPRAISATASAPGYWAQGKSPTIKAGETTPVEYELQPECDPAKVVGTVVNAETGDPIEGAMVQGGNVPAYTDAGGRFEIPEIKPASGNNPRQVALTASAAGFYTQTKMITIFCGARITVDFGSRNSKTGTLVGTVTDETTGAPLKNAFVGTSFGGTATTNDTGAYRIENVPLGDLNAPREWSVNVRPAGYKSSTKTVTVNPDAETRLDFAFGASNAAPVADDQTVELDEDGGKKPLTVTGSDTDAGDTLTYHVMTWPQHGTLEGRLPNVEYRPDGNFNGTDSFEFVVNDGAVNSARGKVDLVVRPTNDRPEAVADQLDLQPDKTTRIPAADLLANDKDIDGDQLHISAVAPWNDKATVTLDGDEVVFTPPPGWSSPSSSVMFAYTVSDGSLEDETIVSAHIERSPVAPRCDDVSFTTARDHPLSERVACTDDNGDAITYALVDAPADGTVDLAADGTFTYTPPAGFAGSASFTYAAKDATDRSTGPVTVHVSVVAANTLPACAAVSASTGEDTPVAVTLDCSDADGDTLDLSVAGQPGHGSVAAVADGKVTYTPSANWSGTDTFTYRAADGAGSSEAATATITVTPVNDAPVCQALTLATDATPAAVAPDCADADGDELTYDVTAQGSKGAASVVDGRLRYAPSAAVSGSDEFRYVARDAAGASPEAKVAVTITPATTDPDPKPEPQPQPQPQPGPVPAPGPPAAPVTGPAPVEGSAALLQCADRPVVLEDVIPAGRRVKLLGLVGKEHAGRKVAIRLEDGDKVVARPTVDAAGRFAAMAPMPKTSSSRDRDRVRFSATLGDDTSRPLRLWRRLQVETVRATGAKVVISGRVAGPLAKSAKDRVIEVRRQAAGCHSGAVVVRGRPDAKGRFRIEVPRAPGETGAVYRLRTKVRNATSDRKLEVTYSLPRVIDFASGD